MKRPPRACYPHSLEMNKTALYLFSFNPQKNLIRQNYYFYIYTKENWDSERLRKLLRLNLFYSNRIVICTQTLLWTKCLCPSNLYLETLTPRVAIFEDDISKVVIKVKWCYRVGPWSYGIIVLIKETSESSYSLSLWHTLKKGHERIQQDGGQLQATKRAFTWKQIGQKLDLGLLAFKSVRKSISAI